VVRGAISPAAGGGERSARVANRDVEVRCRRTSMAAPGQSPDASCVAGNRLPPVENQTTPAELERAGEICTHRPLTVARRTVCSQDERAEPAPRSLSRRKTHFGARRCRRPDDDRHESTPTDRYCLVGGAEPTAVLPARRTCAQAPPQSSPRSATSGSRPRRTVRSRRQTGAARSRPRGESRRIATAAGPQCSRRLEAPRAPTQTPGREIEKGTCLVLVIGGLSSA